MSAANIWGREATTLSMRQEEGATNVIRTGRKRDGGQGSYALISSVRPAVMPVTDFFLMGAAARLSAGDGM